MRISHLIRRYSWHLLYSDSRLAGVLYLGKGSRYTEIVKLNGLKSNVLYTGQVLQIPEK